MKDLFNVSRRGLLLGAAATGLLPRFAFAADSAKLSLEFRIYGGNAPSFLAIEDGTYEKFDLAVTPEGSSGSGESVRRVAAGTHPFGLADASTLVAFAGANPGAAPKLIMPIFDQFPAVILSLKKNPVTSLEDLKKVKLGTGTADAGSKIFPALLARNNIDPKDVNLVTVDVKLRDSMLLTGQVDAVIAFDYTAIFNLIENGVKLEDINLLYYKEFGFDFIGNSLIVNPGVLKDNPDLVKRMARAVSRSWVNANKNRDAAIAAVLQRDKLLNADVERARLDWVLDKHVLTENVKQNGLGSYDKARMESGIEVLKKGFELPDSLAFEDIFVDGFMPPAEDRDIA